jgi:dihydrofolate reductase
VKFVIRLIAALDNRRGVATDSGIPWTLPDDVAHFRDETVSGRILMGWVTYTEFAAPLHGGENYVLSQQPEVLRTGFEAVSSLDALQVKCPGDDIWVIGGAAVFAATIGDADELILTQVLADFHCTKFFPSYDNQFDMIRRDPVRRDGSVDFRFETWRRHQAMSGL